ncbi:MAG: NAD(P)H-hydrate epimerase [Planctomycetota bacterium]
MNEPRCLTRDQARALDRLAIDVIGIPGVVLMENAAINATAVLLDALDARLDLAPADVCACVACGPGNNGGDGFAIARHLHGWGAAVRLYAVRPLEELAGDAAINALACRNLGLPIAFDPDPAAWDRAHLLIDALLGTGFASDTVRSPMDAWIEAVNAAEHADVVAAIDCPSGIDVDTGRPAATTVHADLTVTFAAAKPGLIADAAAKHVGDLVVADIGLPDELLDRVRQTDP